MRIAFVDSVHPVLAERLEKAGHSTTALHQLDDAQLGAALVDFQGIVVRSRPLNAELLRHAPSLRFVARVGSGTENIDRTYCDTQSIRVLNSPEGNRDGVGELCVAQLLALLKHTHRANDQVHRGLWAREENRGTDLFGKNVGIIGFGHMGRSFAEKLSGFGVNVMAHDKYRTPDMGGHVAACSLDRLMEESDVISLHLPLTDETAHYADATFFARAQRPIWFLNTSRGQVVHTEALLDALDQGRVLGAALDVLEFERPDLSGLDPTMEPAIQRRLLAHPGILLTPHIAGVTHEGKYNMAAILANKIIDAFPNDPQP
ncbi:MAG: phosphoglycerate dehydrogenase [Flavobacteriales bacterium]|nr:phosphoglycerate dehydrogenase [Flavobacteriales bacterium]